MSTRIRCSLVVLTTLAALAAAPNAEATDFSFRIDSESAAPLRFGIPGFELARAALRPLGGAFGSGSALVGSAPVGTGPSAVAVDPATHTIYVANGENANGPNAGGDTVSVIDARHCNAADISHCKGPWPTITVGSLPSSIAIDQHTNTVYVSNVASDTAPGTVSVFDGATCNAEDHAGCGQTPATVPVGYGPVGVVEDAGNHTVYVANLGGPFVFGTLPVSTTVSMLDTATCNATDLAACPTTPPPTVDVGSSPLTASVDQATHTVYVTTFASTATQTNSTAAFDADTCNATVQTGCTTIGYIPFADTNPLSLPFDAVVDDANHTLYTSNFDNTISVYDLRQCTAADLSGCATDTAGTVTLPFAGFNQDLGLLFDAPLHTLYAAYQKDDAIMVIDTHRCTGSDPAACATLTPPEIHTGSDPELIALDPNTQTLYTSDAVDNDVSVIDPTRCDAQTTSGCRAHVPEVPISPGGLAADPAVATTYVANGANTVSMIDTITCNAHRPAGCSAALPTVTVGTNPQAVALDPTSDTAYVANAGAGSTGTVTVIDDRKCNSSDQAGCATASTLNVPDGNPVGIAINPRTHTIYVATLTSNGGPNLISVFNGNTCNATTSVGCSQTPGTVATAPDGGPDGSTEAVAVNPSTNTIYATSDTLGSPFLGHTVYVIDGPNCDAADMSGCRNPPATISIGSDPFFGDANPFGIAVDQATDTIYTANIFNGEGPGTVSVINGATCNAHTKSGCDQIPATAPAGFGAIAIAIDPTSNRVYTTNTQDTSVTTINGNTCNSTMTKGCETTRTRPTVGDYPGSISVDGAIQTAYVADGDGISVMPLLP